MSFFSMGMGQEVRPEQLQLAEVEFESLTHLFNGMLDTCKSKCIPARYGEEDLNKGEMCCIDRCVIKYFKSNLMIGDYMRNTGQTVESLSPASLTGTGIRH